MSETQVPTYAVVPTDGRSCLEGCVESLRPQVTGLFVVRNRPGDEVNIPRWWNFGFEKAAEEAAGAPHNLLVCNDDIVVPPDLVQTLSEAMRATTAVLAAPPYLAVSPVTEPLLLIGRPQRQGLQIAGWCFMLRGEAGLRGDPEMPWWYCDDDMEWQARLSGGALVVPGIRPEHLHPGSRDGQFPELIEQSRAAFSSKWGVPV